MQRLGGDPHPLGAALLGIAGSAGAFTDMLPARAEATDRAIEMDALAGSAPNSARLFSLADCRAVKNLGGATTHPAGRKT